MSERFFLWITGGAEREVTREEFIRAERSAGFRSKFGPDHPATAGFSNGVLHGRTENEDLLDAARIAADTP